MIPPSSSAFAPMIATAIESNHMRMRFQSPMLTTSDTAPIVQKSVLLPTKPNTNASANAPHATIGARLAGLTSFMPGREHKAGGLGCFHFLDNRCFACSAAGLLGYLLTSVLRVARDPFTSPISA